MRFVSYRGSQAGFSWRIACSCVGTKTVAEELRESDVVFVGRAISKHIFPVQDTTLPIRYKAYRMEYKFLQSEIYKGVQLTDTITIITGVSGGDCGFEFAVDYEYIIYATYSNKYFENGSEVDGFL